MFGDFYGNLHMLASQEPDCWCFLMDFSRKLHIFGFWGAWDFSRKLHISFLRSHRLCVPVSALHPAALGRRMFGSFGGSLSSKNPPLPGSGLRVCQGCFVLKILGIPDGYASRIY